MCRGVGTIQGYRRCMEGNEDTTHAFMGLPTFPNKFGVVWETLRKFGRRLSSVVFQSRSSSQTRLAL